MKIWIVENKSDYDVGYVTAVFSDLLFAKKYCEEQPNFKGWNDIDPNFPDDLEEKNPNDDFYYNITCLMLDEYKR